MEMDNANPTVFEVNSFQRPPSVSDYDDSVSDPIDELEIFDLIRYLNDPEYPFTLEQLNVTTLDQITVKDKYVNVQFTPTVPHCSMATLIGLAIRVKLERCLPITYKINVSVKEGTHSTGDAISKQLNDKERVAAATENAPLIKMVNNCLNTEK